MGHVHGLGLTAHAMGLSTLAQAKLVVFGYQSDQISPTK